MKHLFLFLLIIVTSSAVLFAQNGKDSVVAKKKSKEIDTAAMRRFNPRKATLYSAVLPGLGQAYNKKYWKIPIVYAALGISAERFFSNQKEYKRVRNAFILKSDNDPLNDTLIDADLQRLSVNALSFYRRQFRQNMDYSVLFFIIFWGLNVVDATVDAHLKYFDVNDNLSMRLRPSLLPNNTAGITLSFDIHKARSRNLAVR